MKRYACIRQHDITDCGAACLAMVSKQHGLKKSIAEIREIAGTDKMGTNALGMIKAAEKLGFAAKGIKGNREALLSEFPLPSMAHMVVDGGLLHYVVIHRITTSKIVIADPGKGIVMYGIDKFCAMWTGVLILLSPTPQFERGGSSSHLFRFFKLLARKSALQRKTRAVQPGADPGSRCLLCRRKSSRSRASDKSRARNLEKRIGFRP